MKQRLNQLILLALLLVVASGIVSAQEENSVRITGLDSSDFPTVRLNLIATGAQSAPLKEFGALSLRENGIPVGDLELSDVSVGVNVTFVIDANVSFHQVDDGSGLTRQEKVKQSIIQYANRFMEDEDRVAIIVPNETEGGGRFLVEHATNADSVARNIESYAAGELDQAPLNDMMLLALAHAADGINDGRFQAILLLTDGAVIHRQLDFPTLVAQAQRIDLPIFTAIIGERVDPTELENASLLYEPTRATYAHLSEVGGADSIYAIWRSNRIQTQVSFRSLQTRSGRYPVTVNLGAARAVTEYTLALAPPSALISPESDVIRRVGDSPDTPLTLLEPMHVSLGLVVQWPDNSPRELAAVNLFVDGQSQLTPSLPLFDANGGTTMDWNIAGLEGGIYTLVVQLVDELGLSAVSEPVMITIEEERPPPPTPTPAATIEAAPAVETEAQQTSSALERLPAALLGAAGIAALWLLLLRRRRKRSEKRPVFKPTAGSEQPLDVPSGRVESVPHIAILEMLEAAPGHVARIRIEGDNVTVGRDHNSAQIVFADESVARLHARIKRRDGRYWLYDEGSAGGTFHNYQRLGLTPQQLQDQDTIHFGHVGLRFHLQQLTDQEESSAEDESSEAEQAPEETAEE